LSHKLTGISFDVRSLGYLPSPQTRAGGQDFDIEARSMNARRSSPEGSIANSTALLEAHIPELRRFARALLRGDRDRADDLVQDSLERAIANWDQRRREGNLRNWLYAIVYNHFLSDQQRRARWNRWLRPLSPTVEDDLPRINGGQAEALAYRDLLRGFAKLSADQRGVLFLVGVENFSYAEAARILNVPTGTVMSRLSRGRECLRQYMEGNHDQIGSPRPAMRRARSSPIVTAPLSVNST
jgi:RNA polymerase sigma factor (sigma-70 family)